MIASATAEAMKTARPLLVCFRGLDLAGVLCELVDVFSEDFHVLAGVFEGLPFRLRDHLVLISGTGSTFELHGEGDADVTAFDVLRS